MTIATALHTFRAMRRASLIALLQLPLAGGCALMADVSGEEARTLVQDGALLVDVRTPEEYAAGHILGAVNVPMGHLENQLPRLAERERPLVVYCHSGSRSHRAKGVLEGIGYQAVHNLGPMTAW